MVFINIFVFLHLFSQICYNDAGSVVQPVFLRIPIGIFVIRQESSKTIADLAVKEVNLHKAFVTAAVWISFLMILSCAQAPTRPPVLQYEKEIIRLTLQADPLLNLYKNMAHTLQLCVYQLKDPDGFNQLAETDEGKYNLLEGGMLDAGIANFMCLNMSPGQSIPFTLDRAQGARYIGIVAGYVTLQMDHITKLISLPDLVVAESGEIKQDMGSSPRIINLKVRLGPQQIEDINGENRPGQGGS